MWQKQTDTAAICEKVGPPMTDFAARRVMMVDTQVRPSDVTKFPIIAAMLATPREAFVPTALRETAYMGEPLHIGEGRVMLDARVLAKLLDALDIQPNELVMDIGCGYGYSSAIIARLSEAVIAIESNEAMAAEAQKRLVAEQADNVAVIAGPLAAGNAKNAPFDVIVLQGGVEQVPEPLLAQLKDGGRIAAIFMQGPLGVAKIGYKSDTVVTWRFAFNAAMPVLDGFGKVAEFSL
jgi:protein-L-isoaspartate(D-aspartate) O-methyltransferase